MHDDFPSPAIWFTHRISYGETDTMGVLYYAEYLHIFERARSEFIRACGMSYRDVEEKDIILPVREAQCRYRSPARYDDLVQVHTAISIRDVERGQDAPAGHGQHPARPGEPSGPSCGRAGLAARSSGQPEIAAA